MLKLMVELFEAMLKKRPSTAQDGSPGAGTFPESESTAFIPEFLLVTPPYYKGSAGNALMHSLCHELCVNGYKAHIVFVNTHRKPFEYYYEKQSDGYAPGLLHTEVSEENYSEYIDGVAKNGIVIYPEIISGNPLNAKHVVRYFLNFDGALTGEKSEYAETDYLLAYSPIFIDKYHALLSKPITDSVFNSDDCLASAERTLDLTYIGKGDKHCECHVIDGTVEITRDWPKTKAELATLLKQTRYFYSWDSISATNLDALLCGATVVLLQDAQIERERLRYSENAFGTYPFLYGKSDGKKVLISPNDSYNSNLKSFRQGVTRSIEGWSVNVNTSALKMLEFFKY